MCIKATMIDSITPHSVINEEHAAASTITARHKIQPLCVVEDRHWSTPQPIVWSQSGHVCALLCVCAGACYSVSIKFTQSRDRTGRIQRLQTSTTGPNSSFCWQQERVDKGPPLHLYVQDTLRPDVMRQRKDSEWDGSWQFSLKKHVTNRELVLHRVCHVHPVFIRKEGDFARACDNHQSSPSGSVFSDGVGAEQ